MAYPPGVFTAYLLYHVDRGTESIERDILLTMTFCSRTISDEWWRAATDALQAQNGFREGKPCPTGLERVSPQMYRYLGGTNVKYQLGPDLSAFLKQDWARQFEGKMFISHHMETIPYENFSIRDFIPNFPAPYPAPVLQPLVGAEPISGKWYYIRSVSTPHEYWHINSATYEVSVSRINRTRFRLDIIPTPSSPSRLSAGPDQYPGKVIIPSDAITIEACKVDLMALIMTRNAKSRYLAHGSRSYGDFKNKDTSPNDTGRVWWFFEELTSGGIGVERRDNKDMGHCLVVCRHGEGETWELVE